MIVHLLEAALRLVGLTLRIREGSGEPVDLAVLCSLYTPKALLDGVCVRPRLHTHTHTHTHKVRGHPSGRMAIALGGLRSRKDSHHGGGQE